MWNQILSFVIAFVINELLRPKPNVQKPPAASINDFDFPTATSDRAIPVVWGTVRMFPNTTWHGDYLAKEVSHEVSTGLFSSTTVTDGYRYHVGMELILCHDSIDELTQVVASDKYPLLSVPVVVTQDQNFRTNFSMFGDWTSAAGQTIHDGVNATCELHCCDRVPSAYMQQMQGVENTSAHPKLTYVVFHGASSVDKPLVSAVSILGYPLHLQTESGFVGSSPSLPPLAFNVKRLPKFKKLDAVEGFKIGQEKRARLTAANDIDGDANPALALAELLTAPVWGADLPAALVDFDSFLAAAETLKAEKNGFSFSWETSRPAVEVQNIIEKQINGKLEKDMSTGRFRMRLVRETDVSVLALDESNITSLSSFVRTGADERTNEVQAQFFDKTELYRTTNVIVQDLGAIRQSDSVIPTTIAYEGVTNQALASNLGLRDLQALSSPLARISLSANMPYGQLLLPGDVVTFNWSALGVHGMRCRVATVRYGLTGNAQLELLQDVFSDASQYYVTPIVPVTPVTPVPTAVVTQHALIQAPYALTGDDADHGLYYAVQPAPQGAASYYKASLCDGPSFDLNKLYVLSKNRADFAVNGALTAALGSAAQVSSLSISVPDEGIAALKAATFSNFFVIIGGEWLLAESYTIASNIVTLHGVQRGIFDTLPVGHMVNSPVTLLLDYVIDSQRMATEIHASNNFGHVVQSFTGHSALSVSCLAFSPAGWGNVYGVPQTLNAGSGRHAALPYGVGNVKINGQYGASESDSDYPNCGSNGLMLSWATRNRLSRTTNSWFVGDNSSEPNTTLKVLLEQRVGGVWQQVLATEGTFESEGNSLFIDPATYGLVKPLDLRLTITPKRAGSNGDYVLGLPQVWCWGWR